MQNLILNANKSVVIPVLVLLILSLSSCGFTLRGSQALPQQYTHVLVNTDYSYAKIRRSLLARLPVYQLTSITEEDALIADATVVLNIQPESLERRLLSVFSTGQVAEYELIYTINYTVIFPNAEPLNATISVAREYQDDPDQVLAKSRELELVLENMREESADRMIRLLSSQYKQANFTRTSY